MPRSAAVLNLMKANDKRTGLQSFKSMSTELTPTLWIGKNGVNDAIVSELREQLKLRKAVKVRILKTALQELNRDSVARELELASGAKLLNLRGATAVFLSPKRVKKERQNVNARQRK
jgi:RNA-binding protein